MNAFPMFERCSLAQWRGYPQIVRDVMDADWKIRGGGGAPGIAGGCGHHLFVLWRVEHVHQLQHTPADILMAIKVDLGPSILDTEKLTIIG